jgi:hypothetical protein
VSGLLATTRLLGVNTSAFSVLSRGKRHSSYCLRKDTSREKNYQFSTTLVALRGRILESLRSMPGVVSASFEMSPMSYSGFEIGARVEGSSLDRMRTSMYT